MAAGALASVSVTVLPLTATGPVFASATAVPPASTVKALPAGTLVSSNGSSNVSTSLAPSSFADTNTGPS